MSKTSSEISISPSILTQGAVLEVSYSVAKDPFNYNESDFLLNNTPLKMMYMSDHIFKGKITHPISYEEENILTVKLTQSKSLNKMISIPKIILGNLQQMENHIFISGNKDFITFLDIKKVNEQMFPILCKYDLNDKTINTTSLPNLNINAIYMDSNNKLYATSIKDRTLYTIDENNNCNIFAQGLGSPFGMVGNKENQFFVADQKGSLFEVKDHKAYFLCEIPVSYKGYYLAVSPFDNSIYISTPSYAGENSIISYNLTTGIKTTILKTYNLVGDITFDKDYFYWIEHNREHSVVQRKAFNSETIENIISGQFFVGITFDKDYEHLYLNDIHNIYTIKKEVLDAQ